MFFPQKSVVDRPVIVPLKSLAHLWSGCMMPSLMRLFSVIRTRHLPVTSCRGIQGDSGRFRGFRRIQGIQEYSGDSGYSGNLEYSEDSEVFRGFRGYRDFRRFVFTCSRKASQ